MMHASKVRITANASNSIHTLGTTYAWGRQPACADRRAYGPRQHVPTRPEKWEGPFIMGYRLLRNSPGAEFRAIIGVVIY